MDAVLKRSEDAKKALKKLKQKMTSRLLKQEITEIEIEKNGVELEKKTVETEITELETELGRRWKRKEVHNRHQTKVKNAAKERTKP